MKKLISLILSIILLMSAVPLPVAATEADVIDYEKLTVLTTLGIVDPLLDASLAATPVTRAEFALYTGSVIGVSEKNVCDKRYYTDLPADHWAVNTINTLTQMGVISGNNGKFNPGDVISEIEAITMLLNAVGCKKIADVKGGFPVGYRALANQFDISSGKGELGEITFADACELLYDTLFAPVAKISNIAIDNKEAYYIDKGTTVLEYYFKVKKAKGVLKSALGISVDAGSACDSEHIRIGDIAYKNECAEAIEYLGREVNAYYRDTKEEKSVFMIFPTGNDECVEIDIKDFESYIPASREVLYRSGSKMKKVAISAGATVVRNGAGYSSKVKEAFQELRKGKILLCKSGEEVYDIVIINNYEDMVVMAINSEQRKIYDRINTKNIIDLYNTDYLKIYDSKKNEKLFDDISEGVILSVCKSDNYCEIIISENTLTGSIAELRNEKNGVKIKLNNVVYTVAKDYYDKNSSSFAVGDTVTAYIDAFGECVYVVKGDDNLYEVGYIVGTAERRTYGNYKMKILRQSGVMQVFDCSDKVIIDGATKKTDAEIEAGLSAKSGKTSRQLIRFRLDKDNKIKRIETAVPYGQKSSSPNMLRAETATKTERYFSGNFMLGPAIKLATDTLCFIVPAADKAGVQDKDFAVVAPSELGSNADYQATAYKINDSTNTVDILLIETSSSALGEWYHHLVLVDSVYEVYDKETEESVQVADVWVNGVKSTYYAADDRTFDKMPIRSDRTKIAKVQAGDVLRVYKNTKGEITEVDFAWSYSTKIPSGLNSTWAGYELYINYGYITSIKEGVVKFEYKENGEDRQGITGEASIAVFDPNANGSENVRAGSQMDLYDAMINKNLIFVAQRYGTTNAIIILK